MTNVQLAQQVLDILTQSGIQYEQFVSDISIWGKPGSLNRSRIHIHVYGPALTVDTTEGPEMAIAKLEVLVKHYDPSATEVSFEIAQNP